LIFSVLAVALGEMRMVHLSLLPNRICGNIVENQVLVAAPMFIFMGVVMEKSRISEDLLLSLQRVLRVVPGGLALAVVLVGTILAAATGIIGASVIMLTVLAVPTMLERGYSPALATGTVASAGTLGILIPPSVMLVFMGDLLTINLAKLFVAALLPGLLLALIYVIYIIMRASLDPTSAPYAPRPNEVEQDGMWLEFTAALILPLLIIMAVLGSILAGWATPTEASGVGAFAALLLAFFRRRLNRQTLGDSLDGSIRTLAMMMLMIFVMGFFFDWIEITLILLPIFAPIVQLMDFGDHVAKADLIYWFAVLMAVNLQTSFLTPPFGFALFFLKGAAGNTVTMQQIYRGIIPFVLLQLAVLAILIWQPSISVWLPNHLLGQ
jgi:tripartite ATP-independent transporter DctM subunit